MNPQGVGVGLRTEHFSHITSQWPAMDWFEAISENFMDTGGRPLRILEQVRARYLLALHGVGLSIGSADPLDQPYLERLKKLVDRIEPFIVSDHLCWSSVDGKNLHDLLPLPYTEEAADYVAARVRQVQDFLGRPILLENVSTYVTYKHSAMPEWEFITAVAKRSGCGILLDLNNIYVNAVNHRFDPFDYLKRVPAGLVGQFHLAGHTDMGDFLFDTHGSPVIDPVWKLYEEAVSRYGQVPTLIEWDADIPEFSRLAEEAEKARQILNFSTGVRPLWKSESYPQGSDPAPRESRDQVWVDSSAPLGMTERANLIEIQRQFKSYIEPGDSEKTNLSDLLNPQGGSDPEERIQVYSNGYIARIHESLCESYEAVRHYAGKEAFMDLAEKYAARFPSENYNLSKAGLFFSNFLESLPEVVQNQPFLPDLARLEWGIAQAFHAFDQPRDKASFSALTGADPALLGMRFQPSVRVLRAWWPVLDLWRGRKEDRPRSSVEKAATTVLIFRKGTEVFCEMLDQAQGELLESLLSGAALGQACEKLLLSHEEELPVDQWFAQWVASGIIQRIFLVK
ncbi:MAG: DUF692 family protein [Candidatus Omnitrophica bacterium]|nr:DUF692 family protein [Candidatus Omnitrophota bacterium]